MKVGNKTLLRQALESMLGFFKQGTPVQGGALLTDSELTLAQIISRALKGELDVRESVAYRGYEIKPRMEMSWPPADRFGYWVTGDVNIGEGKMSNVNVMPGAAWFRTVEEAKEGVDRLELAEGRSDIFWLLNGQAGLSITTTAERKHHSIRCDFAPGTFVSQTGKDITLAARSGLTHAVLNPKQALAVAVMLKEAAEKALGKTL